MQFIWLLIALAAVLAASPDSGGILGDATSSLR
jgi:hypothetical protein